MLSLRKDSIHTACSVSQDLCILAGKLEFCIKQLQTDLSEVCGFAKFEPIFTVGGEVVPIAQMLLMTLSNKSLL